MNEALIVWIDFVFQEIAAACCSCDQHHSCVQCAGNFLQATQLPARQQILQEQQKWRHEVSRVHIHDILIEKRIHSDAYLLD